jgi:L-alanine-DL-glutamate epimerase-like enolase superfamily enzyme
VANIRRRGGCGRPAYRRQRRQQGHAMKITDVECIVLLVPDYRADACSSAQDDLVVRIHTDEGLVGIGETDTNPWVARAMIEAPGTHIMGLGLKEMLIGADPRDVEGLWERMYVGSAMTGRRGLGICAIGALDMALWDLRGKIEGKPVWSLLGGAVRQAVTPYASLLPDGDTLEAYGEALVKRATQAQALGFRAVKLEVCIKGPYSHNSIQVEDDREISRIVAACRAALGPGITVMVDVAYCWRDWKAALRAIEMFADQDIYFVETPLPSDDIDGYAKLAAASPVRIAAGEWLNTRFEFLEYMRQDALDVLQPDVGRVGGLTEARRVALHARDHGLIMVPHCWKSAIGIAASLHLAVVSPTCEYIEFLPAALADSRLRRDLVTEEFALVDGRIPLPDRPGLGVDLDEAAVREFQVR